MGALRTGIAATRSAVAYLVISLYTLVAGPIGIALALTFRWPGLLYRLAIFGVRLGLVIVGIKVKLEGPVPRAGDRAAVYCFNHTSNLDPPIAWIMLRALFPDVLIIYKMVLHRLPVLGYGFDIVGFVAIDRHDREQSIRALQRAARSLRDGKSFMTFPEGTRSLTGDLLPFKKGVFMMAIDAQAPIVPVAIAGARYAMHKGSPIIWPVRVTARVGTPVSTEGLTTADRERVSDAVRGQLHALLADLTSSSVSDLTRPPRT